MLHFTLESILTQPGLVRQAVLSPSRGIPAVCHARCWQSVGEGGRICGGSGLVIELRPA